MQKPTSADTKSGNTANPPTGFTKIHIPALPTIDLNSGPHIPRIRDALQQYCQREIGEIADIFTDGKYKDPVTAAFDSTEFDNDTHGILKQLAIARLKREDAHYDAYVRSKGKLFSVISSMTSRDLDERIQSHQESLNESEKQSLLRGAFAPRAKKATTATGTAPTVQTISTTRCPLFLWKCIIHVTTTTKIGNLKADQNNILIKFATIKQRRNNQTTSRRINIGL